MRWALALETLPHQPLLWLVLLIFNLSFCSPLDSFHSISIIFEEWCSAWKQNPKSYILSTVALLLFSHTTGILMSRKKLFFFATTSSYWCLRLWADFSFLGLLKARQTEFSRKSPYQHHASGGALVNHIKWYLIHLQREPGMCEVHWFSTDHCALLL